MQTVDFDQIKHISSLFLMQTVDFDQIKHISSLFL